jgi:hypothetical protein
VQIIYTKTIFADPTCQARGWLLERMPSLSHRYPTGSQIDGATVGVAILARTVGSALLMGPLAEASL